MSPIVIPCRFCEARPGMGCTLTIDERGVAHGVDGEYHQTRISDAELSSQLLDARAERPSVIKRRKKA